MSQVQFCSLFGTWLCVWLCFFHLASSHHHLDMNFYYIFLLLLVVLSAYSESPQPPDPLVAVCPNSSSDSLGVLAPVLSENEMSGSVLSQNMILPQNEVFRTVLHQNEAFEIVLLQGGIYRVVIDNWQLSNEVKAVIDFVGVSSAFSKNVCLVSV